MNTTNLCVLELDDGRLLQTENQPLSAEQVQHSKRCDICSGAVIESNYCVECRLPVFVKCVDCGRREYADTHDFCYCQLEVLTT